MSLIDYSSDFERHEGLKDNLSDRQDVKGHFGPSIGGILHATKAALLRVESEYRLAHRVPLDASFLSASPLVLCQ